ncbi:hypothetical protein [Halosimplex pelagicum]|uniref:Sodium/phosphate symporter n=1 Tax=Halosimplex pelagicum TaxID=869886 RepID=A0A7D5TAE0_9EURY|nr:hypothetical protein [Halosimplex pelagicum]QLH81353.1 hypothetical protein HZS54_06820 [Halosimplex pelagicum]
MRGRWTPRRTLAALTAVFAVGVALRALPLWQSPLPFNPDGLVHARNVHRTVRTGHFPLSIMATDDLGFGALLAVAQSVTGVRSVALAQPLIAVVGTVPALVAGALATRTSRHLGLAPDRARFAGLLATLLLAVEGIYLYRSMPVDEQTPGLSLLAIAVVSVVAALWSDDRRWFLVALPALLVVPPLHNLEGFVLGLTLLVLAGLAALPRTRSQVPASAALALAVGFWGYFAAYNIGLARLTTAQLTQTGRLTAAPGLLVAWLILCFTVVALVSRSRPRTQRVLLAAPFLTLFALLAVNAVSPVFPGTPTTTRGTLLPALPLLVPILVAVWAYPFLHRTTESNVAVVALAAGPLALIGFALSAALTPAYLDTAVRTHWFLHLPVLALAAVGCAVAVRSVAPDRRRVRTLAVCALVVAVAVSIPVAFAGLSLHPYKGVTTTGEFTASTFAHDHVEGPWTSDNHLVRITNYHSTNVSGTETPLYDWITNPDALPPSCPVVTKDSWVTVGAQFFPQPPATVASDRFRSLHHGSHRVYHGGSTQTLTVLKPRRVSRSQC